ncbi:hypothetical protein [Austwickia chelonae]|uniref:hypothetical protein n=1 Tax=Austwickia chelonae TaxID=100225 RepID=UPI0015A6BAE3|nr:hypothetical protein [Austwickia chelonae]
MRTGKTLAVICIGSASIVLVTGCSFNRSRTPVRATITMSTVTEDAGDEAPDSTGTRSQGIAAPGIAPGKRTTRNAHDGHRPGTSGRQEPRQASSVPGQRGPNPSRSCPTGGPSVPGCPDPARPGASRPAAIPPVSTPTVKPAPPTASPPGKRPTAPATTRPPAPVAPAPAAPHSKLQDPRSRQPI